MISLKECKTCEVEGQYGDETYCTVCGDELIPLVAVKVADLAALNARVEELEKQLKDAQKVAVYFASLNPKALASIGARRLVRTYELQLKGAE